MKNRPFGACPLCVVLAATLFLVLTPPSWSADKQNPAKIVEDLGRRIERVVNGLLPPVVIEGAELRKMKLADRMAALRIPGVSIAMIHDGAIQWARGFGVRSLGGPPVTPDDLFQAGSISKPVTAVAALSLVEEGKLHLDSDVDLALTSWKIPATPLTREAKVTLRELLAHRAGVNVPGFYGYASNALLPSLIATLNGTAPANNPPIIVEVEPGTQYHYSGGGYTIVQQLLIDVGGQPFPRLLQDRVLRPFGMTRSAFLQPLPDDLKREAVTPYLANGEPVGGGAHIYPELAAAGLWTTPSDLARFAIGVQNAVAGRASQVLSQAMAKEMLTPGLGHYGLGPMIGGSRDHPYFWHPGVNIGFASLIVGYESGDGAVIMTNGVRGLELADELMRAIAHEYDWPDFAPVARKLAKVDPAIFNAYQGRYRLAPDVVLTISRQGDRLFAQTPGELQIELLPESVRDFFCMEANVAIKFDTDDQGVATGLIFQQNGEDTPAQRID